MTGRPSKRTPEIEDEIVRRLSDGETLRSICRDPKMPSWTVVYDWKNADEALSLRITRARFDGADAIADDILDIVDNSTNDWMEKLGKDGQPLGYQVNGDHIKRTALRAEMRLKLLAKWFPTKYADRTVNELVGAGGGPVEMSDTAAAARLTALVAALKRKKAEEGEESFG